MATTHVTDRQKQLCFLSSLLLSSTSSSIRCIHLKSSTSGLRRCVMLW